MPVSNTPFMDVVTTTLAATVYSLQTLLLALPAAQKPNIGPSNVLRASYIQIQADPNGSGLFYIGSSATMTTTSAAGAVLVPAQVWSPPSLGGNLYRLDQTFLLSSIAAQKWYVIFITR